MKYIIQFLLIGLSLHVQAQKTEFFYTFDADWHTVKTADSAKYFLRLHQQNDSCWQWDYYRMSGPLLKSERTRDKEGKALEGVSRYYSEHGLLDSVVTFQAGRRNGESYVLKGDSLQVRFKYLYRNDTLVGSTDLSRPARAADGVAQHRQVQESEYPGSTGQWLRFLGKNLKYPERALNANIDGDVRVFFVVDYDGRVIDPYIARSIEYSLDEEALRIIRLSGKWIPSYVDGRSVKAYKIQPIAFRLR